MSIAVLDAAYEAGAAHLTWLENNIIDLANQIDDESKVTDIDIEDGQTYYELTAEGEYSELATLQEAQDIVDSGGTIYTKDADGAYQAYSPPNTGDSEDTSTTLLMLQLQKSTAEWSIGLSTSTNLIKSLSDGCKEVARNY